MSNEDAAGAVELAETGTQAEWERLVDGEHNALDRFPVPGGWLFICFPIHARLSPLIAVQTSSHPSTWL